MLTYLPDLQWCHLAPLRKKGVFGEKTKVKGSEGRPKYMLVGEEEGKEVDCGAAECEIVKSRACRKVPDADLEEWDVLWEEEFQRGPNSSHSQKKKAKKKAEGEGGKGAEGGGEDDNMSQATQESQGESQGETQGESQGESLGESQGESLGESLGESQESRSESGAAEEVEEAPPVETPEAAAAE